MVLSACRTGLGKDVRGEGLIGLTRGFMHAGASSVVASLWKVDDEATAALMTRFYFELWHNKKSPLEALHAAQLWMLQPDREPPASMPADLCARLADADPSDVLAWAGFTHAG